MEIYVPGGHPKVRPGMTEQKYFLYIVLVFAQYYYVYGVTLFELLIHLAHIFL